MLKVMWLRNYFDKIRPSFEENGKLHSFWSLYTGLESFLFVSNETSRTGVSIHDPIDSKRIMSLVVMALMPAMLFGMYNIGYQNYSAAGVQDIPFWSAFVYGLLVLLPKILISYIVGLGIEFAWAQWKHEEMQEGYLVTGILIPLIIPVNTPLWILALSVAFAVIFAKEIFGGTGMNIFNVAIAARMFLFFSYSSKMTGDHVWVANESICGFGHTLPDTFTCATPLSMLMQGDMVSFNWNMIIGLIPGSVGETSVIAIAIGACLLLWTGIASWKTMGSVFLGGIVMASVFQTTGMTEMPWWQHIILGGFCFGAVFMATDPVTSARTETGKYIYGLMVGALAIIVRVMNPGYPEGMMLAIFFGNMFAPLIDYCVIQRNINHRANRICKK